jgi:hypothetical protein
MLSLSSILQTTPEQRKLDSSFVKILETKAGYLKNGNMFFAAKTHSIKERLPNGRIVQAMWKPTYISVIVVLPKSGVHCSCSCMDHKMRNEVALTYRGASEIEYSNGNWPAVNNPSGNPQICKHLVKLAYKLLKQLPGLANY